jgi:hypothetical protein
MVTNIKLGPEGGPFVELDEDTGDFIIRVPNDSVDFDLNELSNISNLIANSAEIDGNTSPYAQDPHDVGGAQHAADTLANLNSKVSDATLDDSGDTREPETHSGTHESGGSDEVNVAGLPGELADPQPSQTQDDGTDVVASPILNFGTALDVSNDSGAAKIDFNTTFFENVPDWVEDGNSPHNTVADGPTFTLASTYDEIQIRIFPNNTGTGGLYMRLNGDSASNYSEVLYDGSETTSTTEIQLSATQRSTSGFIEIDGRWGELCSVRTNIRNEFFDGAVAAVNTGIASPLTTIEFVGATGDPISTDFDIAVYGRDFE